MGKANSKIVELKDYLKAHPLRHLQMREVESLVTGQHEYWKALDGAVLDLMKTNHKLKRLKPFIAGSLALESNLTELSEALGAGIVEERNDKTKSVYKGLLEQCKELITKHERTKQNIQNDLETCRYEAGKRHVNPVELTGFVVGTPLALANIARTYFHKWPWLAEHADGIGAGVGLALGFRHQAKDIFVMTGRALVDSRHVKALGGNIHRSTLKTVMVASRAIQETKEFETHYPDRMALRPKSYCVARL